MLRGGRPERHFAQGLRETLRDAQHILDVGTPQRFAKELRPYESWFAGKRYVAAGDQPRMTYGADNCDCHQDVTAMTFAAESFDAVLCLEVIEHVANPFAAAREIVRAPRPNGRLLLTAPFFYSYHGKAGKSACPGSLWLSRLLALHPSGLGITFPGVARCPGDASWRSCGTPSRPVDSCPLAGTATHPVASRSGRSSACGADYLATLAPGREVTERSPPALPSLIETRP